MSILRTPLFILLGVVCGAALATGGAYIFAQSYSGQAILRDFLVAQSKTMLAAQAPVAVATSTPSTPPGILPIPEKYATVDYFNAINNVLQDVFALNAVSAQMGPLLDTLNRQTLSCSYVGFYENMGRAHQLSNKNQTLISQLGVHLSALAAANVQTKDIVTKANTQALVAAGGAFTASLQAYASAANGLLAGDTPTSAQIADFQSKVNAATGASQVFADALKPLMEHILEGVQAAIDAASTTTR